LVTRENELGPRRKKTKRTPGPLQNQKVDDLRSQRLIPGDIPRRGKEKEDVKNLGKAGDDKVLGGPAEATTLS